MPRLALTIVFAILGITGFTGLAHADACDVLFDICTFQESGNVSFVNSNAQISLPQFNPALGTLLAVNVPIQLGDNVTGTASFNSSVCMPNCLASFSADFLGNGVFLGASGPDALLVPGPPFQVPWSLTGPGGVFNDTSGPMYIGTGQWTLPLTLNLDVDPDSFFFGGLESISIDSPLAEQWSASINYMFTPVPEPRLALSTALLFGFILLLARRRRGAV